MVRVVAFLVVSLLTAAAQAEPIPVRWDELTASDWPKAMQQSGATCVLPIGILEKHGMHLPMGSDLIKVRELAARAAKKEYVVVFPDYFYGQINEARHQPGTFALTEKVTWALLEATVDEIGRNGFRHIVLVNGHGGNPDFLHYFVQAQLERRRNYALYLFEPDTDQAYEARVAKARKSDANNDLHAGENETSSLLYLRPDLVQQGRARNESGADQKRLDLPNVYTGIWWYARYPNHYAGQGETGSRELGQLMTEHSIDTLVQTLKAVKADHKTLDLQKEFFDRVDKLGK
jgi:creatinine amidohydrolase